MTPMTISKFVSKHILWMSALALVSAIPPGAAAQCGMSIKAKPSAWQWQQGANQSKLVRTGFDEDGDHGTSIVGLWHAVFTAETMNDAPFSAQFDNSLVTWHRDGTEIMNSSRPAQDGNFCMGVWTRTGKLKYLLNHLPWQGNDPANAPNGIGNPTGGAQLIEKIELSPDSDCYTGTFVLKGYDVSGNVTVTITGSIKAKRITTSTPFTDLL